MKDAARPGRRGAIQRGRHTPESRRGVESATTGPTWGACPCGGGCPVCASPRVSTVPAAPPQTLPEAVTAALETPGRALGPATGRRFAQAIATAAPGGRQSVPRRATVIARREARVSRAADTEEKETERLIAELSALLDAHPLEPPPDDTPLRTVRIHTDAAAHQAARSLGARAFAIGSDVFFANGKFAPGTSVGDRLLLHELLHVVRNADIFEPVIFRDGESEPAPPETSISLSVSLDGVVLDFGSVVYAEGRTRMQFFGLLLRRLLGPEYRQGLEQRVLPSWQRLLQSVDLTLINDLREDNTSPAGRRIGQRFMRAAGVLLLIRVLEQEFQLHVGLSDSQRELLRLGVATASAWEEIKDLLPEWYTPFIFRRQMAQHAPLLRRWSQVEASANQQDRDAAIDAVFGVLAAPARVLESVRLDFEIANEPLNEQPNDDVLTRANRIDSYVGYSSLWNISVRPGTRLTQAPEPVVRFEAHAAGFLSFVQTQPQLMERALQPDNHQVLVSLVARYGRFTRRLLRAERGDERLLNRPARANTPAWDATLSSSPPLQPPLYDAALETDHAFTMHIQFAHWTDAFAAYRYRWEFMQVPDSLTGDQVPDMTMAAGQRPDRGTVLDTRLARARRYNAADLENVRRRLGGAPFGQAVDLIHLNNALRIVGTYIRDTTERATEPRYTTRIVFPRAAIYVVRCRALPILEGDEEIVRPPSVALLPVVARNPDEMAVSRVQESRQTEFQARLRLAEIQSLLAAPFPPENADALRREQEELENYLQEPGEALTRQRGVLDAQIQLLERRLALRQQIAERSRAEQPNQQEIAALRRQLAEIGGETANPFEERDLRELRSRRDTLTDMITTRDARRSRAGRFATRSAPHATFVSDLGATIALALEIWDRGVVDDHYEVFISDLTTPDSGEAVGTSPLTGVRDPYATAVLNGVTELLKSSSDYGRGRVAIYIGNEIHTLSIHEAGTGRLLSEAVESGVTVLSIAAIVAAPFTEGASLYLLLPLGAIGAAPSAYRLYQRHEESRLRLDLAAVMDVVNVVAGVIGLAHAATPLRMVRMGRVLMVMGLGADGAGILLMGAGIVVQLDALRNLPEHERAARMLEIIGNAMLQIGIQAGGTIAHARYQGRRTGAAPEPHQRVPGDEPGFHPPAREAAPVAHDTAVPAAPDTAAPGDRSMSGSGRRPPGEVPPVSTPSRPALPEAASPERLFGELERGVERAQPPASTRGQVENPPPSGEYRRNLRTSEAAYRAYNEALRVSNGREVAIYHNPQTGEYRVMIGTETGVRAPQPHGWNAIVHFHPIPEGTLTFRLPAPQDFNGLLMRYFAEGTHVREFVEFDIPGVGRGRTEYGIDPANPEPYYVRIHQPDGTTQTLRFAHDGAYHAYWGERTVYVEPGSPAYEAMIRDIQDFVRSVRNGEAGDFGPGSRSRAESPPPAASTPGDRSMSGSGPGAQAPRSIDLQTAHGDLTPAGIELIRRRFRTAEENGRPVRLDTLTDAQIAERFPNQPSWLEAIVTAEVRAQWVGRGTATDFAMTNSRQTLNDVAARLRTAIDSASTGHTLHDAILSWSVWDYVREMVRQNDPTLAPAFNALENLPSTPQNQTLRNRWREFKTSRVRGDMSGFFLGTVGSKRPDIVEVMLSSDAIHITDATFAYGDPIHNFKSAFYRSVIERLITVSTVTSTDYRSPFRQTPVGP